MLGSREILRIGLALVVLSAGCGHEDRGPTELGAEVAGYYQLTRINGQPLPADTRGAETLPSSGQRILSGNLTLGESKAVYRNYVRCVSVPSCSQSSMNIVGTWSFLSTGGGSFKWGPNISTDASIEGKVVKEYWAKDTLEFVKQ